MPMDPIYFDHNATTPVAPAVVEAMWPFLHREFGNPSSPHRFARKPAMAVAKAREQVAYLCGAPAPRHIVFTSGGTESNALALHAALAERKGRDHILISAVEHVSVLGWRSRWEAQGYTVQVIPVDGSGRLDLSVMANALSDRTALVSVMLANNESGHLYPVAELAAMAHRVGALIHTDASQAIGKIPVDLTALGVDYAAGCGHKYNAIKGIGFLYCAEPSSMSPFMVGGEQEMGVRPGTESVPGIVALGAASELARGWLASTAPIAMARRREAFENWVTTSLAGTEIVGRNEPRLPNTTLLLVEGVETEPLLALLDLDGIACSSGSACASGAHEPSHVLAALGKADGRAVVRVSAGRDTTDADYQRLQIVMSDSISRLRRHVS